jgi:hypothetical protein
MDSSNQYLCQDELKKKGFVTIGLSGLDREISFLISERNPTIVEFVGFRGGG